MKKAYFFVPIMAMMLLTACDKNAEVKQFVNELATAVSTNDKVAIEKMYPDATKADSLSLTFDADKAQIEELEGGGWKVDLSEGKDIIIVKSEADGTFSVKESHGMFAYPDKRITFACGTGQYDASLTDVENAERMADTLFMAWMQNKAIESQKALVKVTESSVDEQWDNPDFKEGFPQIPIIFTVVVSNETDEEICSDEYSVFAEITSVWIEKCAYEVTKSSPYSTLKTLRGKNIPAKGTATITWKKMIDMSGSGHEGDFAMQCTLNYSPKKTPSLDSYLPTGHEYKEYLEDSAAPTEE